MELAFPVLERRLGDDDEMGAFDALLKLEVPEEGDGLKSLAETLD